MFASEYVVASFDDVCRVLDQTTAPVPHVRVTGALRRKSGTVAAMEIEWPDPSTPAGRRTGEIRIIRVQSGTAPLTEMLLVARAPGGTADARPLLENLVKRVEAEVSAMSGAGRHPLPAGWQ